MDDLHSDPRYAAHVNIDDLPRRPFGGPLFSEPPPTGYDLARAEVERILAAITDAIAEAVRRIGVALIHLTYPAENGMYIDIDSIHSIDSPTRSDEHGIKFGLGSLG